MTRWKERPCEERTLEQLCEQRGSEPCSLSENHGEILNFGRRGASSVLSLGLVLGQGAQTLQLRHESSSCLLELYLLIPPCPWPLRGQASGTWPLEVRSSGFGKSC